LVHDRGTYKLYESFMSSAPRLVGTISDERNCFVCGDVVCVGKGTASAFTCADGKCTEVKTAASPSLKALDDLKPLAVVGTSVHFVSAPSSKPVRYCVLNCRTLEAKCTAIDVEGTYVDAAVSAAKLYVAVRNGDVVAIYAFDRRDGSIEKVFEEAVTGDVFAAGGADGALFSITKAFRVPRE